jgi:hypothetical protein
LFYLKKIAEHAETSNIKETIHKNTDYTMTIDNWLKEIKNRLYNFPFLINQLDAFYNNKKYLLEMINQFKNEKRFLLVKEKCEITEFVKIQQNEYLHQLKECLNLTEDYRIVSILEKSDDNRYYMKYVKVPLTTYAEEEAFYCRINFERKNYKIIAYVEIGFDYPKR